ncbi:hypothetical protein [uncultured Dysosmobacter sp.]|uniref:hypothetical protein n=1 Tax=uncultured Dysosmobacter sp. TaxID=2591384 RepID=UPI002615AE27|nr:hypothetical protein [uncultured Dysosmobacter sp.]
MSTMHPERLLLLLSGCGIIREVLPEQAAASSREETASAEEILPAEAPLPEEEAAADDLESGPLETVTYLPESLIQDLYTRMLNGTDTYEDFEPLLAERELSEEETAALAPELLTSVYAEHAIYSTYYAVDFDNDGIEDIYVHRRMGMGSMGMFRSSFYRGLSDGTYESAYFTENCMSLPMFISWEGKNYLLCLQWDQPSKDGIRQESYIGLSVSVFVDGWEQESAGLFFDPTALWTEGLYDESGTQIGWEEGAPADRDISLAVYTRGINTDFALPVH